VNGAERICETLRDLGVSTVFGLPGTQNLVLYDALRRSGLRNVAASDEGAAAFMAGGYARASGRVGVLTTIPGPGFVYALAGIVEAHHDSVPLLWITLRSTDDGQAFPLQQIDQVAMATPVVKRCWLVDQAGLLADVLTEAHDVAMSGEPGPVLVEVAVPLLVQSASAATTSSTPTHYAAVPADLIDRARGAQRPLIIAGQGAQGAATVVRELAAQWAAPVLFTSSGRGVLPDAHPNAVVCDLSFGVPEAVASLVERADLILVLGCKFTHNGSAGGRLRLPQAKLVRVDTSADVIAANYPASVALCARAEDVVAELLAVLARSRWTDPELADLHLQAARSRDEPIEHEPAIAGSPRASVRALFAAMAHAFGSDVVYTADAGLHQALTRRYAQVVSSRGLLVPSDFQSMGFGLPGAIGAALARPGAVVVACVGDGALMLSMGELLTAVHEGVDLVVMVFNDGAYGLIRRQQLLNFGFTEATVLPSVDYSALAAAVGCSYFPLAGPLDERLKQVASTAGVRLVEVRLGEAGSLGLQALRSAVREKLVRSAPEGALQLLKRALRR
jgi:acetolactate synthase I/II/III large subunit